MRAPFLGEAHAGAMKSPWPPNEVFRRMFMRYRRYPSRPPPLPRDAPEPPRGSFARVMDTLSVRPPISAVFILPTASAASRPPGVLISSECDGITVGAPGRTRRQASGIGYAIWRRWWGKPWGSEFL